MRLRNHRGGVGQYFEDGYLEAGKLVREVHESTCSHCGHMTEVVRLADFNNERVVGFCRGCMSPICLGCVGKPCVTQEMECEMIERAVRKQILIREWF